MSLPRLLAGPFLLAFALSAARAAEPQRIDPRGLPGPLVIAGGAKELPADVRDAFLARAGKEPKIVVISTDAEAGNETVSYWNRLTPDVAEHLQATDRKKADEKFAKPLAEATGVWLVGADAANFTKVYAGTAVEKELKKAHARGAVVGAAGACAELFGNFDLLPGYAVGSRKVVDAALKENPTRVGFALGEKSGITIRGRVARVIGDSPITVCVTKGAGKPAANDEYEAGALLDLVQLQRAAINRASKEPFPPAKPAAPNVPKGALVIVGGGGASADIWKRFIELAGGPDAAIVVVTSAMDDPLPPESVEEKILKKYGAKKVVPLHTRDRKQADDPKFSEVLTKAGGVWFSGGRQWRFVDSYEGTLTEKRFREVLARGGVIGGSSAGASIQSEFMPRGHPLGNTVMAAEGYERGFGFLPGCAVDQHFFARKRTGDMTGLMKQYPQYLGVGIDEGTAIIVTGSTAQVIGKSKVAFYDAGKKPDGDKDYEEVFPNEKYDLKGPKKVK
jgi:cyanophycinase